MKKSVIDNRNLLLKYNIPHEYATDEAVYIKTRNALYELDLNTFANNPYVFRVINITKKTSKLVSKDTFLRLMCDYFKLPFEHWDEKIKQKELSATKEVPKSIVIGGLYTTTWAKPFAIWKLKDVIGETDVILSSPKTGVEITSKLSDLRLWTNLPK